MDIDIIVISTILLGELLLLAWLRFGRLRTWFYILLVFVLILGSVGIREYWATRNWQIALCLGSLFFMILGLPAIAVGYIYKKYSLTDLPH